MMMMYVLPIESVGPHLQVSYGEMVGCDNEDVCERDDDEKGSREW
jgi:hypothetical protein